MQLRTYLASIATLLYGSLERLGDSTLTSGPQRSLGDCKPYYIGEQGGVETRPFNEITSRERRPGRNLVDDSGKEIGAEVYDLLLSLLHGIRGQKRQKPSRIPQGRIHPRGTKESNTNNEDRS